MVDRTSAVALEVRGLHVYYGQSHALQGVDLSLKNGVLSVVGRNGMGKTTLCKAIMGMVPVSSGTINFAGQNLIGKTPTEIARLGIGYVPQGRRLWRSLSVDEHLRLMQKPKGAWSVDRIYATFPRLAERKSNGGAQLSGGEQQMLAISRALLLNPKLLVMDEPTEGLAPVIVDQVADMLVRIGSEGDIDVLVIEQNIGVATSVSDEVAVMVNGRVSRVMQSHLLASDKELQQRLLGVGRHGNEGESVQEQATSPVGRHTVRAPDRIFQSNPSTPTRWAKLPSVRTLEQLARTVTAAPVIQKLSGVPTRFSNPAVNRLVLIVGAMNRRPEELRFVSAQLKEHGVPTQIVDLSDTQGDGQAFRRIVDGQGAVAGAIGIAGLDDGVDIAAGLAGLVLAAPKLLLCPATLRSGSACAEGAGITMMPTLAETFGVTRLNRDILRRAAMAMVGMVNSGPRQQDEQPAAMPVLAVTRFAGTDRVADLVSRKAKQFDVWGFSADGVGSSIIPRLCAEGRIDILADLSMMDIADFVCGGTAPCDRLAIGAVDYFGTCGGLDTVRLDAVTAAAAGQRGRKVFPLSGSLWGMRVLPEEASAIGRHIGNALNAMSGRIYLYWPERGLSEADRIRGAAADPQADAALLSALERTLRKTASRQLIKVPFSANDPKLADIVVSDMPGEAKSLRLTRAHR
ncbi:Tm-1-like ATP-binding domain-containing protein [Agrobacterium sp. NPDC058088]|uniref:ATP-binding cassette domain-containing protein n=1 Tax=Agrobacterium sp. NPDC058088 TaxID=3346335 RepID=UPI0036DD9340